MNGLLVALGAVAVVLVAVLISSTLTAPTAKQRLGQAALKAAQRGEVEVCISILERERVSWLAARLVCEEARQ
jgi:hypothetical protein